jgi:hypothetical protein
MSSECPEALRDLTMLVQNYFSHKVPVLCPAGHAVDGQGWQESTGILQELFTHIPSEQASAKTTRAPTPTQTSNPQRHFVSTLGPVWKTGRVSYKTNFSIMDQKTMYYQTNAIDK